MTGTTDSRLQTITLVGDSKLVAIGESYLKQIDLRQRQVALTVQILDVNLDNDTQISNNFAFRSGNAFIVSQEGQLLANFGAYKPPSSQEGGSPGAYSGAANTNPLSGIGSLNNGNGFLDVPQASVPFPGSPTTVGGFPEDPFGLILVPIAIRFSQAFRRSTKTEKLLTNHQLASFTQRISFLISYVQVLRQALQRFWLIQL